MKNLKLISFSVPLFYILIVLLPSCRNETVKNKTVTAAYVQSAYYLPLLIAENDNLFNKYGYTLELKKFQDNSQMINSFINGNLDLTAQSALTMFPISELHPDTIKFIYGQYCNSYNFVVGKNSHYQSLADLKNDTIGIWKSPTAEAFVKLILKKKGLVFRKDYQIKRFDASSLVASMENGYTKVLFGFDIPLAVLTSSDKYRYLQLNEIKTLAPSGKLFNGGAMINIKLIKDDPQKADVIKKVLFEALNIIHKNRIHAMEVLSKKMKVPINIVQSAYIDDFQYPNDSLTQSAFTMFKLLYINQIVHQWKNESAFKSLFWN